MPERLHVLIEGRVQGVGFRYSTLDQALALGLNGWVRNVPGGGVEAEFEGERGALDQMLSWCQQGPFGARVRSVSPSWSSGDAKYQRFEIRHY
ncbi:MAG: acylphosphatase [Candidatus Hydrogenedentes bacterium]|nr:acylphosphatase [Candidatus Hydrogenedentota bacterium]MBI3119687.1 acylphosphatase [Candidatus Hydrogenedentota bacterium]